MNSSKANKKCKKRCQGPYLSWMSAPDIKEPRVSEWRVRSLETGVCNAAGCANASSVVAGSNANTDSRGEEVSKTSDFEESNARYDVEIADHRDSVLCIVGEDIVPNSVNAGVQDFEGCPPNNDGVISVQFFEEECSPHCYCSNCQYADDEEFSLCNDVEGNEV